MKEKIVLHSALSPDAVLDALRRSTDEERRTIFSLSGYKGKQPVICKFTATGFHLRKRRFYRNDYARLFFAQLEPEPGGSRIEGYFDFSRLVKIGMYFWLALVAVITAPLYMSSAQDIITGTHHVSGNPWMGIFAPFFMIGAGMIAPAFGRLMGRRQERLLVEFLQSTLAARREEQDFAISNFK